MRIFADPRPAGWAGVYRLYDADGLLLYVGSGGEPKARIQAHIRQKGWGADIAVVVIEWYPADWQARQAEQIAIRHESPIHNVIRYRVAA